MGPVPLQV
jgi:IS30 family transposase